MRESMLMPPGVRGFIQVEKWEKNILWFKSIIENPAGSGASLYDQSMHLCTVQIDF